MKRKVCSPRSPLAALVALAASVSIIAPACADERASMGREQKDFASFLKDYEVFMKKRNIDSQRHKAVFGGDLVFHEACSPSFYMDEMSSCECPTGNRYLQCLTSARATITADPNDIGGRGYVLVMSGSSFLDSSGNWKPLPKRNAYTSIIERIGQTHTFSIPIPDRATIDRLCSGNDGTTPFSFVVGYGAAMPMEIEFAHRMKDRSAQVGHPFDEEAYVFSRARLNGMRSKKAGEIGYAFCRPAAERVGPPGIPRGP